MGTPFQGYYPATIDTGSSDPWVLGYRAPNYEKYVAAPFASSKSLTYQVSGKSGVEDVEGKTYMLNTVRALDGD